jgi:hypothetical protein
MSASSDFDGERAVGVRAAGRGANELVKVRREVIFSAGAIQSLLPDAAVRYSRRVVLPTDILEGLQGSRNVCHDTPVQ